MSSVCKPASVNTEDDVIAARRVWQQLGRASDDVITGCDREAVAMGHCTINDVITGCDWETVAAGRCTIDDVMTGCDWETEAVTGRLWWACHQITARC